MRTFLFQANQQASSEPSIDVQNLQDQLIASKMREAETNLSTRELEQKVNELEKYWQVEVKFMSWFFFNESILQKPVRI